MAWYILALAGLVTVPLAGYGGFKLLLDLELRFGEGKLRVLRTTRALERQGFKVDPATAREIARRLGADGIRRLERQPRMRWKPGGEIVLTDVDVALFPLAESNTWEVTDAGSGPWSITGDTTAGHKIIWYDGTELPLIKVTPPPGLVELTENEHTGAAVRHLAQGFEDLFRALGPPPSGLKYDSGLPVSDGGGGTKR